MTEDALWRATKTAADCPQLFSHDAPFLQLRSAVVRRAGRAILTVDEFDLAHGEHLALLGPNGSGKSTFVRLITREILPPHRDEPPVRLNGRDRITLTEVKRCV